MAETSHNVRITATDEATPVLDGVNKKIDELAGKSSAAESAAGARLGSAGQRLGAVSSAIDRQSAAVAESSVNWQALGATMGRVGAIAVKTAALAGASAVAGSMAAYTGYRILAENAKGFLDSSILLRKDIDATEAEYRGLTSSMLDMAAKSGLSSSTLLGVGAELGGMGAAVGDITTIVDQAITAHRALDMSLQDSAATLFQTKNTWQFTNEELSKSTDIIAALDNASTASASQIMASMAKTSAFARENGISFANWAAITATALESGLSPQVVGGTLQKTVSLLGSGAKDTKKFSAGLKMLGLSTKEFKSLRAKDDFGALVKLIEAAAKSPRGVDALNQMFGTQQASVLMSLQGNIDKLKEFRRIAYSPDTIGTAGRNAVIVGSTTAELEKRIASSIQVFRERMGEGAAELRNIELTAWDKLLEYQMKEGSMGKFADTVSEFFRNVWQEATGETTLSAASGRITSAMDELIEKSRMARASFGEPAPEGGWVDTLSSKVGELLANLGKVAYNAMDNTGVTLGDYKGSKYITPGNVKTDNRLPNEKMRELSDLERRRLGLAEGKKYYTTNKDSEPVVFSNQVMPDEDVKKANESTNQLRALTWKGGDFFQGGETFDFFVGRFYKSLLDQIVKEKQMREQNWFGDAEKPGSLFDPRPVNPYLGIPAAATSLPSASFPIPKPRPGSPGWAPDRFGPPAGSFTPRAPLPNTSGGAFGPPILPQTAPQPQPQQVTVSPSVQASASVTPNVSITVYAQTVAGDLAGRVAAGLKGAEGAYGAVTREAAGKNISNTITGPGN